jgi:hypothetical protein
MASQVTVATRDHRHSGDLSPAQIYDRTGETSPNAFAAPFRYHMVSRPADGDKTTRFVRSSHPHYPRRSRQL